MSFVSYSQNFEDVLLWRALRHVEDGRYLDIGAQDPRVDSVSLAFYEAGWRGVHVEPTSAYAAALREARPDERVIQALVSDEMGTGTIYEFAGTGLSTGIAAIAEQHRANGYRPKKRKVERISLAEILDLFGDDEIHWMKIDVEGMERRVLRSWRDHPARPWVLVIESTFPGTPTFTCDEWIEEVLNRGYRNVFFDGLSTFFVHETHEEIAAALKVPANVFDCFAVEEPHFSVQLLRERLRAEYESSLRLSTDENRARIASLADQLEQERSAHRDARREADRSLRQLVTSEMARRTAVEGAWRDWNDRESELREQIGRLQADLAKSADDAARELLKLERAHQAAMESASREWIEREGELRGELAKLQTDFLATSIDLAREQQRASAVDRERATIGAELEVLKARRASLDLHVNGLRNSLAQLESALDRERRRAEEEAGRRSTAEKDSLKLAAIEERLAAREREIESLESARERDVRGLELARLEAEETGRQLQAEFADHRDKMSSQIQGLQDRLVQRERQLEDFRRVAIHLVSERRGVRRRLADLFGMQGEDPVRAQLASWVFNPDAQFEPLEPTIYNLSTKISSGGPIVHFPASDAERNPYLRADSLGELLSWVDVSFVRCAYVTVLGRQPDREGETFYTSLLRQGHSKMEILWRLRRSEEGRQHDPGIRGFDRALRRAAWARKRVFGAIARLFWGGEADGAVHRALRALMNGQALESGSTRARLEATEQSIRAQGAQLQQLLELSHTLTAASTEIRALLDRPEAASPSPSNDAAVEDVQQPPIQPMPGVLLRRIGRVAKIGV